MIVEEIIMESESVVELGSSSGSRYPRTVLGFFTVPSNFIVHGNQYRSPTSFVYTSEEGQALKEGRWGNLDGSLSFLDQQYFTIVGSSNGLLLCKVDTLDEIMNFLTAEEKNMHYIACNPVTRQFRRLPKTHKPAFQAHPAFICKGGGLTDLDNEEVHFEVVRAGWPNKKLFSTMMEIETFSSLTNNWSEATLVCDTPFILTPGMQTTFMIGGVIFWNVVIGGPMGYISSDHSLLAYDHSATGLQRAILIKGPRGQEDGQKFSNLMGDYYGQSEGRVQYARWDKVNLEIWILEDYRIRSNNYWVMKHQVRLNEIKGNVPPGNVRVKFWIDGVDFMDHVATERDMVRSFHPGNSRLVFVTLSDGAFWYDLESSQRKGIVEDFNTPLMHGYFLYEWPLSPLID